MIHCLSAIVLWLGSADAQVVKTLRLSDESVAQVVVSTRGTVLSFPVKPTKVILGKAQSFGVEYVESDIAISPLSLGARSNLFVYLYGRRFAFDLVASDSAASSVILVKDALDPEYQKSKKKKAQ